jgi:hypothetical protein
MGKQKSKTLTILEIEGRVNRLLRDHKTSYDLWRKERFEKPSDNAPNSTRETPSKKRAEKIAHA